MPELLWPLDDIDPNIGVLPAIMSSEETCSYKDLARLVEHVAHKMIVRGLEPGDRVLLAGSPSIELVIALLAGMRLGLTACPVNPAWPTASLDSAMQTVQAKTLILDASMAELGQGGAAGLQLTLHDLVTLLNGEAEPLPPFAPHEGGTAIFTSGSMGEPKAALVSTANHLANGLASNRNIAVEPGDRWLLSLPLHHVAGLAIMFRCLLGGGTVVLPETETSLEESIQRHGVTHLSVVATQLQRLLRNPDSANILEGLKAVLAGGGPIPEASIREALDCGLPLFTTYGLTEMASQVTVTEPNASLEELLTAGRPLCDGSLDLAEDGEILVRGETLFKGYASGTSLERPMTEQGWFATGDLGRYDAEKRLIVTGRKDNRFVSGGENIQPEEIERCLCSLESVEQAIVTPIPHEEFGLVPVAFVELSPGMPFEEATLVDHVTRFLPRYKHPKAFHAWPTGAEGKSFKPSREALRTIARTLSR